MFSWAKKSVSGIPQIHEHSPKTKIIKEATKSANEFLDLLPKLPSHYARASTTKLYLEPIINSKKHLYELYKSHCQLNEKKCASRFQLSSAFDAKNLGLFSPKKDQCDVCCSFKVGQCTEAIYKTHIAKKIAAREEKIIDKCLALKGKCHVLTMDLQSVKLSPMLNASALYYKTKLAVHNFTVYNLKSHQSTCYWWDESEGDLVASTFTTCISDYLITKFDDELPIIIYSDGCTYQNRNAMLSNALLQIAVDKNKDITQKYLEKGHTQMECDSVHSAIESELKNKTINVPTDYVNICENARRKQPYETKYLSHDFFKDYSMKKNQRYASIRPGTKAGDPCVTDLRAIKYISDGTIQYKLNHNDDDWLNLPVKPKPIVTLPYPPLYCSRLEITQRKYKDLQELKQVIPIEHHSFYDNLPHK